MALQSIARSERGEARSRPPQSMCASWLQYEDRRTQPAGDIETEHHCPMWCSFCVSRRLMSTDHTASAQCRHGALGILRHLEPAQILIYKRFGIAIKRKGTGVEQPVVD